MCRAWWRTPLVPALRRQRQADFWVQGQPGLQSEFQDSQGYTEKLCLGKTKKKKKKKKESVCSVFCLHVYSPCACLMSKEARRGYQILWNWSYRQLLSCHVILENQIWVLWKNSLNYPAIFPIPKVWPRLVLNSWSSCLCFLNISYWHVLLQLAFSYVKTKLAWNSEIHQQTSASQVLKLKACTTTSDKIES
jgi:hypothetical protein